MRFVLLASAEYAALAQMAAHTMRLHHPKAEIVHMTDMETLQLELATTVVRDAGLDPKDPPRFIRTRMALLAGLGDGNTAVLDADTLVCKPISILWEQGFDVALIRRNKNRQPYNAGVMFARKAAFWANLLERMDADPRYCQPFGDQEALALEARCGKWRLNELDQTWNNSEMTQFNLKAETRIAHYKGARRRQWMPIHFNRGRWK